MTPKTDSVAVLREIEREMRELAASIARAGINGFGNHASMLADRLATLHPAPPVADAVTEGRELVALIQSELEQVAPPLSMMETRSDYWKAGAREAIHAVNRAINAHNAALASRTGKGEANV